MAHSSPGAPTVGPVTTPSPMPLSSAPPAVPRRRLHPYPLLPLRPRRPPRLSPRWGCSARRLPPPAPPPGDPLRPWRHRRPRWWSRIRRPGAGLSAGASTPGPDRTQLLRPWPGREVRRRRPALVGAHGGGPTRRARTSPGASAGRALTVLRAETVAYDPGARRATVAVEVLEVVGSPPLSRRYTGTWQVVRGGPAGSSTSPTSAPVDPPLTGAPAPHRRPSRRHLVDGLPRLVRPDVVPVQGHPQPGALRHRDVPPAVHRLQGVRVVAGVDGGPGALMEGCTRPSS